MSMFNNDSCFMWELRSILGGFKILSYLLFPARLCHSISIDKVQSFMICLAPFFHISLVSGSFFLTDINLVCNYNILTVIV